MRIATEIAKGVEYLHVKMNPPMIYGDLKSANVLLGEGYDVKLSDFGYAKEGPKKVLTKIYGTPGYCDPYYAKTGILSLKSDIYSFGVVLLELISGRRAFDDRRPDDEQYVVSWVSQCWFFCSKKLSLPNSSSLEFELPIISSKLLVMSYPQTYEIAVECSNK